MKSITLILALFATVTAARVPTTFVAKNSALNIRGGGEIGPLDADLALQLGKAATSAFVAGSASKYIAGATGGTAPQLADFFTGDLMALNALATTVACGMYGLTGNDFDSLKVGLVTWAIAMGLKIQDAGGVGNTGDVVKDNVLLTLIGVSVLYIVFA
eukprot:scaffold60984_cov47-Attheya_sp.AAC.3